MSIETKVLGELERLRRVLGSCVHRNCEGGDCMACYHCKQFDDYLIENADDLLAAARDAERLREAIENEPEFPDDMPDEMWEKLRSDREALTEAFRETVRVMKRNTLAALSRDGGG